jgi:hypothetical protein
MSVQEAIGYAIAFTLAGGILLMRIRHGQR